MSDRQTGHTEFDELAAGYVLDALEPADEQRFLQHAAQCPDCPRTMARFREVTVALAGTTPPAEPPAGLGERIMAATRPKPGAASVVELRPRQRWRWLAAAAAVLVAVGGVWGGLAATSGGPQAPLAACAQPHKCAETALDAEATHQLAGKVVVLDGEVWMEPTDMSANGTGAIYVLWQIIGTRAPLAIGAFDVRAGAHAPIKVGGLAGPYAGTSAFAISLEPGHTVPAAPTHVVATGDVS